VVICVYVDDCLITGNREAVDLAMADIESTFEIRRLGPLEALEEYIGCTIQKMAGGSNKIIQPDMIKKLAKTFGYTVINYRYAATPMGTGITVERPKENDRKLSEEQQKYYRKGVGMLLYLVKH
jgi:hypothetical protein